MNDDILQGKWKEVRGHAKEWWAKLNDDDLNRIQGKWDVLTGLLQQKYGYTREQADQEIKRRMKELEQQHQPTR